MRIDTSRDSHQPERHYRQVLQRQGQVLLDAEWNEQRAIDDHQRHTAVADIVGETGAPMDAPAFELAFSGANVRVGAGRYYVDGVLVENDNPVDLRQQPHAPTGTPIFLDGDGSDLGSPSAGVYLAELDVWTRLVTALDDGALREVAVPVPDTASRAQTVWQVRMIQVADSGTVLGCGDPVPVWNALRTDPTGRLRARAEPGDDSTTPCEIPAGAGYRGPDNQHYRVEIREGGAAGDATFVWSRENGSVHGRWLGQSGNELTVSVPSRGASLGFSPDDWIELVDDTLEAAGQFGPMVQIESVGDDTIEIRPATAIGTIDHSSAGPNAKIRRWEAPPQPLGTGFVALERGVEVEFDATGTYATGQWWNIVARTPLNDIIWPELGGQPAFVPADGPDHSYASLGLAEFDGAGWTLLDDCRPIIPPLTRMTTLGYAGGDGQTASPDPTNPATLVKLAEDLRVSVTNGNVPVEGETVEFQVMTGNGRIDVGAGPVATATVTTDADGMAAVNWQVDSGTASQVVRARLVRPGGPLDAPIFFSASLLHAGVVTLMPTACPELAGAATVQDAIETLCTITSDGCATIVVTPGDDWSAPLRAIPSGTSARICFRPGVYQLADTVIFSDLVDVVLDGAGLGSHINGEQLETLFRFERCGRVGIRDLRLSSRRAFHPGPEPGRGGVITAVDCREVDVQQTRVDGAGAKRRAGACITVNGPAGGTRVVVRDCHLRPGHLQDGVIVVDGRQVRIQDNVIETAPKSAGLSFQQLLTDADRRKRLIGQLIADPRNVVSGVPAGGGGGLQVGTWTVNFSSVVEDKGWVAQIDANPPSDNDLRNAEAVRAYMQRLAVEATEDETRFPAYGSWIGNLRTSIGSGQVDRLLRDTAGSRSIQASLLNQVLVTPTADAGERVVVSRGAGQVSFLSPIPAGSWQQALNIMQAPASLSSAALRADAVRRGRERPRRRSGTQPGNRLS